MNSDINIIKTIRFVISILLFITVSQYLFISDFSNIVNRFMSTTTETTTLTSLILIILAIDLYSTYPFAKVSLKSWNKTQLINLAWVFIIFIITFIFLYFKSSEFAIWTDELNQFAWSAISPITASGIQYQTPLSYFQSYIAELLIPDRRLAVRFSTILNFSLSTVLIFFIVKFFTKKIIYSFLIIIFFFTNFSLLYSSVDARPQSLSLLFALLFIFELYLTQSKSNINFKQSLSLFSITALFLLSIGLQPPFFLLAFYISYLIYFYRKQSFKHTAKLSITLFIAGLAYLPHQLYTIKISSSKFYKIDFGSFLHKNFTQFQWINFDKLKLFVISGYIYFIFTISLLVLFKYFIKINKLKDNSSNYDISYLLFLVTGTFLFNIILFNFYKNNVNYFFDHRYIFIMFPLFYLSLTLSIAKLISFTKNQRTLIKLLIVITILPLVAFLKFSTYQELKASKAWAMFDGEKLYTHITETIPHKSRIFCLSANWGHLYKNCSGIEHLNRAYKLRDENKIYQDKKYFSYELYPEWNGYWGPNLSKLQSEELTFIFMSNLNTLKKLSIFLDIKQARIMGNSYILNIKVKNNFSDDAYLLLNKVKKFLDTNNFNYRKEFTNFLNTQNRN